MHGPWREEKQLASPKESANRQQAAGPRFLSSGRNTPEDLNGHLKLVIHLVAYDKSFTSYSAGKPATSH